MTRARLAGSLTAGHRVASDYPLHRHRVLQSAMIEDDAHTLTPSLSRRPRRNAPVRGADSDSGGCLREACAVLVSPLALRRLYCQSTSAGLTPAWSNPEAREMSR